MPLQGHLSAGVEAPSPLLEALPGQQLSLLEAAQKARVHWWEMNLGVAALAFFRRRRCLLLLPTPQLALYPACTHVCPPGAFGWGQSDQRGRGQPRTVPGALAWEVEGADSSPAHTAPLCLGSCLSFRASVSLCVSGGGGRSPSQGRWEDEVRSAES